MKSGMTRRGFLRHLAMSTATAVLAACAPQAGEPEKVVTQEVEKVVKETVVVTKDHLNLRIGWWGGLSRNDIFNQLCDMYQDLHPDITLVREYAAWSDYWTRVATQAAGGNLPDITKSVFDSLAEYGERGVYAPLDDMVEAKTIDLSDWDPIVANCGKVKDATYQIPSGVCVNCLALNKDMIQEAGVELPKFDTSYEEWASFLRELQPKLPAQTWAGSYGPANEHHFQGWILQKGYQIANEDGTNVGFPKEIVVELFQYWKELYDAGLVMPMDVWNQPLNDMWADAHISVGRLATVYTDNNELKIYQQYTDDDLVIIRQLVMPDGVYRTGDFLRGSGWSLAATSKHLQEGADFVNWFVNDIEAAKVFSMELGAVGSRSVQEALRDTIHPKDVLVLDHFNEILKELPPKMVDPKGTSAVKTAQRRACDAICYGTPVEEAVDAFMSEAEEIYRTANA